VYERVRTTADVYGRCGLWYTNAGDIKRAEGDVMTRERLFTLEEVAQQLGVNVETVRRWARNGEIEVIDLGGRAGYRVSESALDKFIRTRIKPIKDE
jgi:excisionase family DNA binding protein